MMTQQQQQRAGGQQANEQQPSTRIASSRSLSRINQHATSIDQVIDQQTNRHIDSYTMLWSVVVVIALVALIAGVVVKIRSSSGEWSRVPAATIAPNSLSPNFTCIVTGT